MDILFPFGNKSTIWLDIFYRLLCEEWTLQRKNKKCDRPKKKVTNLLF
jgi:hypothetical protein